MDDTIRRLVDICVTHVVASFKNLDQTYQWNIPATAPVSFQRDAGSLWKANRNLRAALSKEWREARDDEIRFQLAKWYVSKWGGVRGNSDSTLLGYVSHAPNDLANSRINGVSTWSKILALQEPNRYQIYDARVATSLNALQVKHGATPIAIFQMPASQNRVISAFKSWTREFGWDNELRHKSYTVYLQLVAGIASAINLPEEVIEMVFFADAVQLAQEARGKYSANAWAFYH